MSSRLVRCNVLGASRGAPGRAFRAVERAVLKLPLSENQAPASQRALDHFAQGAESFALAVLFLRDEVGRKIIGARVMDVLSA